MGGKKYREGNLALRKCPKILRRAEGAFSWRAGWVWGSGVGKDGWEESACVVMVLLVPGQYSQ